MKRCYVCKEMKSLEEFHKNSARKDGRRDECKPCVCAYKSNYRKKNVDKIKIYQRGYCRNRRKNDPLFRLKRNLSTRTSLAFTTKYWTKNSGNIDILGTDYETAFKHIESQFKEGMTWDNRGEWHIDHIIPLSSAKTEEEMEKLCHYTNIQPLWKEENILKGNKIL
ncbi:MAG: hypothetical protein Tp131SUR933471_1 [Prokaryotic dsDNA virus sp.]|nr:MAG: hypothetical protein Tp131SUR933471_1 [Prokaryotic dsDNA virus sp.]|tara:strand:- start:51 stop:548 length:498 start_codon:yes stop_codon:yes gene_type:complete